MSRATLVIMAAGIGSRFGGGIKQLAPVGPNGEMLMWLTPIRRQRIFLKNTAKDSAEEQNPGELDRLSSAAEMWLIPPFLS